MGAWGRGSLEARDTSGFGACIRRRLHFHAPVLPLPLSPSRLLSTPPRFFEGPPSKRGAHLHADGVDGIGRGGDAAVVVQGGAEVVGERVLPLQAPEHRGAGPAAIRQLELGPPNGGAIEVHLGDFSVGGEAQASGAAHVSSSGSL